MAELDQMNVKANEQDTQGTDYDIRDRKLTTATGQQVVNSSDVILLKDTSGNFHEIAKDSFMSAVRGALGSLIKSYDKGTNINGVAVTGSTGTVNDLGFSSPSDLATVLGVTQDSSTILLPNFVNNTIQTGIYRTTQQVYMVTVSGDVPNYHCYLLFMGLEGQYCRVKPICNIGDVNKLQFYLDSNERLYLFKESSAFTCKVSIVSLMNIKDYCGDMSLTGDISGMTQITEVS